MRCSWLSTHGAQSARDAGTRRSMLTARVHRGQECDSTCPETLKQTAKNSAYWLLVIVCRRGGPAEAHWDRASYQQGTDQTRRSSPSLLLRVRPSADLDLLQLHSCRKFSCSPPQLP